MLFIIGFSAVVMGVWMGYFTKNASTTMDFFKWNEKKVMRWWLSLFIVGMVLSYILSQGAIFQLQHTEIPEDSAFHFRDWRSMFEFSLAFFFLPLLLLANVFSLTTKKVNVFLYGFTFLYAAIFSYKNLQNISEFFQLWEKHFQIGSELLAQEASGVWVHISVYAFLCLFNMAFIWWGLKK